MKNVEEYHNCKTDLDKIHYETYDKISAGVKIRRKCHVYYTKISN